MRSVTLDNLATRTLVTLPPMPRTRTCPNVVGDVGPVRMVACCSVGATRSLPLLALADGSPFMGGGGDAGHDRSPKAARPYAASSAAACVVPCTRSYPPALLSLPMPLFPCPHSP